MASKWAVRIALAFSVIPGRINFPIKTVKMALPPFPNPKRHKLKAISAL